MSTKNDIINDYTRGSILGNLCRFSIPFILTNILQLVYAIVDMIVVGRVVGGAAIAGVSVASHAFSFLVLSCSGLTMGGQIYISQMLGGGGRDKLNRTLGSFFSLMLLLAATVSVLTFLFAEPLLRLLKTPPESFDYAVTYIRVNCFGVIFTYGYSMFASAMRGLGDSKHPLYFIVLSSLLNLVLDVWFVAGLNWAVFGAAIATVIAQVVKFAASWVYLYRRRADFGFDFKLPSWRIDGGTAKGILRIGIPLAVRYGTLQVSTLFVHSLINGLGYQATAVFGIGQRCDGVASHITVGIFSGASGIIGKNFGAHKFNRIRMTVRYTWLLCGCFYVLYTVALLCFNSELFGCFTKDSGVIALAPVFAHAIVWQFPGLTFNRGIVALIHGIGNAWLSFVFAFLDAFLLRIVLSWLLGVVMGMGLKGFILGYGLASYGIAVPGLIYYFFCPWHKREAVTKA